MLIVLFQKERGRSPTVKTSPTSKKAKSPEVYKPGKTVQPSKGRKASPEVYKPEKTGPASKERQRSPEVYKPEKTVPASKERQRSPEVYKPEKTGPASKERQRSPEVFKPDKKRSPLRDPRLSRSGSSSSARKPVGEQPPAPTSARRPKPSLPRGAPPVVVKFAKAGSSTSSQKAPDNDGKKVDELGKRQRRTVVDPDALASFTRAEEEAAAKAKAAKKPSRTAKDPDESEPDSDSSDSEDEEQERRGHYIEKSFHGRPYKVIFPKSLN